MNKSIWLKETLDIPPKMAMGIPVTIPILKILLPTTFPIAMSYSPFLVAITDVTNSGRDVPRAIMVKAIIFSLIPKSLAKLEAWSTTRLLPKMIEINPITVKIKAF